MIPSANIAIANNDCINISQDLRWPNNLVNIHTPLLSMIGAGIILRL